MYKLLIFLALALSLFSVSFAHAQHHGGQAAPPISFGDRKVTVSTWLDPADFNPKEDTSATLHVRFYDSDTNTNIERVTYRVQVLSGDTLLASQMFFNKNGELLVKIQPNSQCSEKDIWRCTKYEGNKDPVVPSALESTAESIPIIRGPLFDKSGPFTVKVAIIGASNPKTQTAQDIDFETKINIAQEQQFPLATQSGKTTVTVRSFQDELTNFQFAESTKTISFEMPFHWEHAEHVSLVRNDLEIPKSFTLFQGVNGFQGTVNGVPIYSKDITVDSYSSKDSNIVHFAVTGEELKMLAQKVTDKHTMSVQIFPDTNMVLKRTDVKFSNGYKASVSYDPRFGPSKDIPMTVAFFDSSGILAKDIRYAYSIQDSQGKEIIVNTGSGGNSVGISVPSGADSRLVTIPSKGSYTLQMYLVGRGLIDFDQYVPVSVKLDITEASSTPSPKQAPDQKTTIPKTETKTDKTLPTKTSKDTKKDVPKKTIIKKEIVKKTDSKKPSSSTTPKPTK